MNEIEELVENSLILAASHTDYLPTSLSRNICHTLYYLQYQFNCSFTMINIPEELEQLGYLSRVPYHQLPMPEKEEAEKLLHTGGFLSDGDYVDAASQSVYVTADSPLWPRIFGTEKEQIELLDILDIADFFIPLAAAAHNTGYSCGTKTLSLWYAVFPLFYSFVGKDETDYLDESRLLNLLEYISPDILEVANMYVNMKIYDELKTKIPHMEMWVEPYTLWREEHELDPDFCRNEIVELNSVGNFSKAAYLASKITDEKDRMLYQAITSVAYNQSGIGCAGNPSSDEDIISLEEAKQLLEFLVENSDSQIQDYLAKTYLACCYVFFEEYDNALDVLHKSFEPAIQQASSLKNDYLRISSTAIIALSYYSMINDLFKDTQALQNERFPGMPLLSEIRSSLESLIGLKPENDCRLLFDISLCYMYENDPENVRRVLREILLKNPDNADAAEKLAVLDNLTFKNKDALKDVSRL